MIKLEERFNDFYNKLEESVRNTFSYVYFHKGNDTSFHDEVNAFTREQAWYLAQKAHPGCVIRDMTQMTDNQEKVINDGEQLSFLEE